MSRCPGSRCGQVWFRWEPASWLADGCPLGVSLHSTKQRVWPSYLLPFHGHQSHSWGLHTQGLPASLRHHKGGCDFNIWLVLRHKHSAQGSQLAPPASGGMPSVYWQGRETCFTEGSARCAGWTHRCKPWTLEPLSLTLKEQETPRRAGTQAAHMLR